MGPRRPRTEARLAARDRAQADHAVAAQQERLKRMRRGRTEDTSGVTGVYATKEYHGPRCEKLGDVPQTERVLFISPYDALDDRYRPCTTCKPGP